MCHETTARPPAPPISGGAGPASGGRLILEADDGNRLLAFAATSVSLRAPGVVVLPDVRGLHPFYQQLAVRFAEAGVNATAIDYFGRTAGILERDEDFDFMTHFRQVTSEGVHADVAAAIAHVRSEAGGGSQRVFTLGFCAGGRLSFNQAVDQDVDGVIGFYGGPQGRGPEDQRAPIMLAPGYRCPVLGLFGGADRNIPVEAIDGFRDALTEAGVPNEIVVYDGAPHSFFDRRFEEHREACADAWRRVLTFVRAAGA